MELKNGRSIRCKRQAVKNTHLESSMRRIMDFDKNKHLTRVARSINYHGNQRIALTRLRATAPGIFNATKKDFDNNWPSSGDLYF